jgi:hypothetical protein
LGNQRANLGAASQDRARYELLTSNFAALPFRHRILNQLAQLRPANSMSFLGITWVPSK